MMTPTVFVVSADAAVGDSVRALAESVSLQAEVFSSLRALLGTVGTDRRGCLVFDQDVSHAGDAERGARLAIACAMLPTVLIADLGDVATAVAAVKAGAADVVQRPYREQKLLDSIRDALKADEHAPH